MFHCGYQISEEYPHYIHGLPHLIGHASGSAEGAIKKIDRAIKVGISYPNGTLRYEAKDLTSNILRMTYRGYILEYGPNARHSDYSVRVIDNKNFISREEFTGLTVPHMVQSAINFIDALETKILTAAIA